MGAEHSGRLFHLNIRGYCGERCWREWLTHCHRCWMKRITTLLNDSKKASGLPS